MARQCVFKDEFFAPKWKWRSENASIRRRHPSSKTRVSPSVPSGPNSASGVHRELFGDAGDSAICPGQPIADSLGGNLNGDGASELNGTALGVASREA
eukprot:scaffold73313_cov27-Tisochrysis_lutea.AAC.5